MGKFLRRAAGALGVLLLLPALGASAQSNDGPAVPVTVAPVASVAVADRRTVSAEVTARHRAVLAAEVTGRIVEFETDSGDDVTAGAVLVRIDPTVYELALRRAEADLASVEAEITRAKSRLARIEALAERDYASDDELQVESTSLAVLERTRERRRVDRDQARVELARTRVLAPFDGIVESRDAQLGSYVAPGTPLLTLAQRDDREVVADLHPEQAATLADGRELSFVGDGGSSPLRIIRVSPVISPNSRMQTVRLAFAAEPQKIGALGELRWRTTRGKLPSDFVLLRDGKLGVFVADGNRAAFIELPGAAQGRPTSYDLPDDTRVIVDGRQRLQDGDLIRISQP